MTLKESILARLALAERDEVSIPLGVTLRLREITRAQWRAAIEWAQTENLAEREKARGNALAVADLADEDARRAALMQYWGELPERVMILERWYVGLLAVSAIDPETGAALFTRDEIMAWPQRAELWDEVARLGQAVLDLSEVGESHLKKESSPSSPQTE